MTVRVALWLGMALALLPASLSASRGEGSEVTDMAHSSGAEARILWFDASANFARLSNRQGVRSIMQKCRDANLNMAVLDVKDITGRVLYNSAIAPHEIEMDGVRREPDYDMLRVAVDEARQAGIAPYASINVFSEGRQGHGGPAVDHPAWQSVIYTPEPWLETENDRYPAATVGKRALPGRLAVFERAADAGERRPGETYAVLDRQADRVVCVNPESLPDSGVLFVAEGEAGTWLSKLKPGGYAHLAARPRFVPSGLAAEEHNAIFVNPADPQARAYELSIIKELVQNYDIDGLVLDRMRYPGINSDFSDLSRKEFEAWLGKSVENWPVDIIEFGPLPSDKPAWGPLFPKWIQWRAGVITSFLKQARSVIEASGKETSVYVGSWYWDYYPLGVNWASDKFQPETEWADRTYASTGYAALNDWMTTGCYYPVPTREEAKEAGKSPGGTVEAAAETSVKVIGAASFTYGGLYLLDYKGDPERFCRAVDVCQRITQGVMLFDLVYVEEYGWWDLLKAAFPEPAPIPHKIPELRRQTRELYQSR